MVSYKTSYSTWVLRNAYYPLPSDQDESEADYLEASNLLVTRTRLSAYLKLRAFGI